MQQCCHQYCLWDSFYSNDIVASNNVVISIISDIATVQCPGSPARCLYSTGAVLHHYLHLTFQIRQWLPSPWLGCAGGAASGSPLHEVIPTQAQQPELMQYDGVDARCTSQSWCSGCCICVIVKKVHEVVHIHELMYSFHNMSWQCQQC